MSKFPSLIFGLSFAVSTLTTAAAAQQSNTSKIPPLVIEKQGSFFVGGHDVHSDTLSTLPAYAPTGTVTVDQMYVRYLVREGGAPIDHAHTRLLPHWKNLGNHTGWSNGMG